MEAGTRQDGNTEHGREIWPLDSRHRSVYRCTSRKITLLEAVIICEMAGRFANSTPASRNNSLQATNVFSSTYSHVLARMKLPFLFQTCYAPWRQAPASLKRGSIGSMISAQSVSSHIMSPLLAYFEVMELINLGSNLKSPVGCRCGCGYGSNLRQSRLQDSTVTPR